MVKSLFGLALLHSYFLGETAAVLSEAPYMYNTERPLVIGHRGSFGHNPEHSLGSYADAYFGGVDFIELDVHPSKDGILVTNHDQTLEQTTNVESISIFDDKKSTRLEGEGYYIDDFTFAELKLIKRKQRYSYRSHFYDNMFGIMSAQEVIDLVNTLNADQPRREEATEKVGLYIELKKYDFYVDEGFDTA